MDSFKVLIAFAFVIACVLAAPEPIAPNSAVDEPVVAASEPLEGQGPAREKKQALYPYGYGAYPYAHYGGYPYSSYPYYSGYPYSYAYSYYDDGKYYPGKYDKIASYKGYPYGAYPYYPYNHYY